MWTEITRPKYERKALRYATDVTDAEWALIAPHLPAPRTLGQPRTTRRREVVNAIFYMLRAGCP
jgi:transposase